MAEFETDAETVIEPGSPAAPAPEPEPEDAERPSGSPYKEVLREEMAAAGVFRRKEPEPELAAGESVRETLKQTVDQADPIGRELEPGIVEKASKAGLSRDEFVGRMLNEFTAIMRDPATSVGELVGNLRACGDTGAAVQAWKNATAALGLELGPDGRLVPVSATAHPPAARPAAPRGRAA